MPSAALLLLLLCTTVALASVTGGPAGPVELTADTFDEHVVHSGKRAFVKFFAPWCGHCKSMKPAWDELGAAHKDSESVVIADVDCTQHAALCSRFGVKGYPTIKYFGKSSPKEGATYNGGRSLEQLQKFVTNQLMAA
jgi:protein disulfide-isomerase-like protein